MPPRSLKSFSIAGGSENFTRTLLSNVYHTLAMGKIIFRPTIWLSLIASFFIIVMGTVSPAVTGMEKDSLPPASAIATAVKPATLEPAIVSGELVQILLMTGVTETVLVRCTPGAAPALTPRPVAGAPMESGRSEGVITCVAGA